MIKGKIDPEINIEEKQFKPVYIDLSKITAEKVLLALEIDYDQAKLERTTTIIREHDKATREEFEKEIKRVTVNVADRDMRVLDKGDVPIQRLAPESILRAVERQFDNEEIEEL